MRATAARAQALPHTTGGTVAGGDSARAVWAPPASRLATTVGEGVGTAPPCQADCQKEHVYRWRYICIFYSGASLSGDGKRLLLLENAIRQGERAPYTTGHSASICCCLLNGPIKSANPPTETCCTAHFR